MVRLSILTTLTFNVLCCSFFSLERNNFCIIGKKKPLLWHCWGGTVLSGRVVWPPVAHPEWIMDRELISWSIRLFSPRGEHCLEHLLVGWKRKITSLKVFPQFIYIEKYNVLSLKHSESSTTIFIILWPTTWEGFFHITISPQIWNQVLPMNIF